MGRASTIFVTPVQGRVRAARGLPESPEAPERRAHWLPLGGQRSLAALPQRAGPAFGNGHPAHSPTTYGRVGVPWVGRCGHLLRLDAHCVIRWAGPNAGSGLARLEERPDRCGAALEDARRRPPAPGAAAGPPAPGCPRRPWPRRRTSPRGAATFIGRWRCRNHKRRFGQSRLTDRRYRTYPVGPQGLHPIVEWGLRGLAAVQLVQRPGIRAPRPQRCLSGAQSRARHGNPSVSRSSTVGPSAPAGGARAWAGPVQAAPSASPGDRDPANHRWVDDHREHLYPASALWAA